jgi:APA family basic amino acid/polyamine antiporter
MVADHAASPSEASTSPATRLARRLGTFDAVAIGLGAMIGAGVFSAYGPAARAAGKGLLLGLLVAAAVAYCNAASSAQLAALYPEAGGAYVYGRRRLGSLWGFLAGWGFVIGKVASCSAMALTFASYAFPSHLRPVAVGAVLAVTIVNYFGVKKTALVTRGIVATVLLSLAVVVAAVWFGGETQASRLWPPVEGGPYGILQAAGFLFFAFAGYARLATLGEEVLDPARVIPRAIPLALGITLLVYATVAVSLLLALDTETIGRVPAPLAAAVEAGSLGGLAPAVRIGAAVACLGVLLSLLAGVSRTAFAMAANHDLPHALAAVHPRHKIPHRAEIAAGVLVATAVALVDLRSAIGFSSFAVLLYYAVANAAAWTVPKADRRWPRWVSAAGLLGCVVIAFSLPLVSIVAGSGLLVAGAAVHLVRARRRSR